MVEAVKVILPYVAIAPKADFKTLVPVALFCGIGLLLSLSVLILDQHIPGEWF